MVIVCIVLVVMKLSRGYLSYMECLVFFFKSGEM